MWNYSEKVKDHFFNPRNAKVVEDANAVGDVGSLSCGDALRLMLKVNPETDVIEDAGFQTFGCGSAIASSSALTELIIGQTLDEAKKLTNQDIATYLDGLPPEKMHCSVMGEEALQVAIAHYRGETIEEDDEDEGALICRCFAVDEGKIIKAVKTNHLTTLEDVINYTKAGGACASCHEKIENLLAKIAKEQIVELEPDSESAKALGPKPEPEVISETREAAQIIPTQEVVANEVLSDQENLVAIGKVIEALRPNLQLDGGDIELVGVRGNEVAVILSGNCQGCMMTEMTLGWLSQQLLEKLGHYYRLVTVQPKEEVSA
ncbi:Fe-S cluster assembly protein NifU [Celerinatantimonas sp. YJH-8]|uniref:Fe-S cluster assembly protein NifU n=1 Tax=Celerinatantimonas sp. YJH-8 TaxID=3228714 RepID=UPI0038C28B76